MHIDTAVATAHHLLGSAISTSMSELHLRMLMGYLAATSLRVRIVPNLSAGFTEVRNI